MLSMIMNTQYFTPIKTLFPVTLFSAMKVRVGGVNSGVDDVCPRLML